jgi:hypothetical protein
VWFENNQPTDDKKEKKPKKLSFKKIKANNQGFGLKIKSALKKIFTKQLAIIVGVIVLIVAIVFGGVKLYDYSRVAYLKPYQEKYGIEYPVGISKSFCDQYGINQHTVGKLTISDTETDVYVANQVTDSYAYMTDGSDVYTEQQFMSIDVTGYADIESAYSTTDGFLNSSQSVTFNTLFDDAEYRVIAVYYVNKNPSDDSDYVFPYTIYGNLTQKSFDFYVDSIEHRRLYDTGYELSYENSYLSLCADSDFMDDFKFVVLCVKVKNSDFEKSTTATANDDIHYPQIWYDENNQTNPYRFSSKWYPEIYTDTDLTETSDLTVDDFEIK